MPGRLYRQDRPISDYFEHGTIRLTLAGIIAKSSNIGTVMANDLYGNGQQEAQPVRNAQRGPARTRGEAEPV